jgi:hypothetical protein
MRAVSPARQAGMACASTASSPRARLVCSWSASQSAACASLVTRPWSTADSMPSEYEKPPTGSAGDASQISCSSAVSVVVFVAAVVMVVPVIVTMP